MAPDSFDIGFKNQKTNLDFPRIFDNPFAKYPMIIECISCISSYLLKSK